MKKFISVSMFFMKDIIWNNGQSEKVYEKEVTKKKKRRRDKEVTV